MIIIHSLVFQKQQINKGKQTFLNFCQRKVKLVKLRDKKFTTRPIIPLKLNSDAKVPCWLAVSQEYQV